MRRGTSRPSFRRGIVIFAVGLVGLGVVIHFVLEQVMEHYAKRESTVRASILPQLAIPVEIPGPHPGPIRPPSGSRYKRSSSNN